MIQITVIPYGIIFQYKIHPWYTPYQFAGNKPIWCIDLDGLEEFVATEQPNCSWTYKKNPRYDPNDPEQKGMAVPKYQGNQTGQWLITPKEVSSQFVNGVISVNSRRNPIAKTVLNTPTKNTTKKTVKTVNESRMKSDPIEEDEDEEKKEPIPETEDPIPDLPLLEDYQGKIQTEWHCNQYPCSIPSHHKKIGSASDQWQADVSKFANWLVKHPYKVVNVTISLGGIPGDTPSTKIDDGWIVSHTTYYDLYKLKVATYMEAIKKISPDAAKRVFFKMGKIMGTEKIDEQVIKP